MSKYNPKKIESKWQRYWEAKKLYRANDDSKKPKYYQLETFPYPSAAGLHIGHPKGYIAEDIHARYMRMKGKEVLYTMGWDAFGLPTENYAIKVGKSPQEVAKSNIKNFKRQVQMFGLSYDWEREINTSKPEYYKWTQWLFLQLYKVGLAYQKMAKVNWCPSCMTVLANEQLVDGKCERCGTEVVQKEMKQWFFKITDYADRLLADINELDWPKETVKRQEDWIGKSEGAVIDFYINQSLLSGEVAFASNNRGKAKRMQTLLKKMGISVVLKIPEELGIKNFNVVENGKTIQENSEKKAQTLAKLTNMPVLADDSGFFIDGIEINPVMVKRNALEEVDEKSLSIEQIAQKMQNYYKSIANSRGGKVDAEWRNALCLITPGGYVRHTETIRPVILTNQSRGKVDPYLPLRGLYISKTTGKYVLEQTEEEESKELQPITEGIKKLFKSAVTVFTTRPDTLFGATYLVLAPEHSIIENLKLEIGNWDEVRKYIEKAKHKTELQRKEETGEKTGVELKGIKAINPATKEEIPVWVAGYVLGGYGTGAIMAVPAHDERDFEFAKKFGLSVKPVVLKNTGQSRSYIMGVSEEDLKKIGVEIIEKTKDGFFKVKIPFEKLDSYKKFIRQWMKPNFWNEFTTLSGFYFIFKHKDGQLEELELNEKTNDLIDKYGMTFNDEEPNKEPENVYSWLAENDFYKEVLIHQDTGVIINSGKFDGMDSEKAKWEITKFVRGEKQTQYKLRDWSVSRQRYWGVPIPMIYCGKCEMVPVPEEDLPVKLPMLKDYRPKGMPPLASSEKFLKVKCPKCGDSAQRDPETLDTFVDSSWYYLRYTDPHNKKGFASKEKLGYWLGCRLAPPKPCVGGVDLYVIGAEHVTAHLLYARFMTKFLYDQGYLSASGGEEPFLKLRHQGMILGPDGKRMSKRWGNVINPDDVIGEYGADAVRLYEMFMGPFEDGQPWDTKGLVGTYRFLNRVWNFISKLEEPDKMDMSAEKVINKYIKEIGDDIQNFKFNTGVSGLMKMLNKLEDKWLTKKQYETFLKLLAPFAPHIAEELWQNILENKNSIHSEEWPEYDEALLVEKIIKLVIQVNGRVRDTIEAKKGMSENEATKIALESEKVKKYVPDKPKKVIYIRDRLINFVI